MDNWSRNFRSQFIYTYVVSEGDLTPEQVLQDKLIEKARVDALTITEETNPDRGTTIYRYTGKYDNQSLTPVPKGADVMRGGKLDTKKVDDETLSFSTRPGNGWVTSIEKVNATGYLIATKDTDNHVSIIPNPAVEKIYGNMADWRASYNNANAEPHFYTKILNAISTMVK